MCSWCTGSERATKGETCADQMTDSFQAHKDVMQFLSQARAMRYAFVKRLYCAVCAVFMGVLSTSFSTNPRSFTTTTPSCLTTNLPFFPHNQPSFTTHRQPSLLTHHQPSHSHTTTSHPWLTSRHFVFSNVSDVSTIIVLERYHAIGSAVGHHVIKHASATISCVQTRFALH